MLGARTEKSMPDANLVDDGPPITGEQLLRMGDIGPCELIDGRVVLMSSTGGEHGRVEALVAAQLLQVVRPRTGSRAPS